MPNDNQSETVSAYCDTCDYEQKADKIVLENQGWHLGRREQFCPECNY